MSDVSFYYNEREDNGKRIGVSVDGNRALEWYEAGDEERNPGLRWYLDVVFAADPAPATQEEALQWFTAHSATIRTCLNKTAELLESGIDADQIPWAIDFSMPEGPVRVTVSAKRRYVAVDIANRIRNFVNKDLIAFGSNCELVG